MAAKKTAEKLADEVREQQIDVHHENVTNVPPTDGTEEVLASTVKSGKDKVVSLHSIGQETILEVDGKEVAKLDREALLGLARATRAATAAL